MKRDLLQELIAWKDSPLRRPLILCGANQVGKTWLINEFSKTFSSCIKIDFINDKNASSLFVKVLKLHLVILFVALKHMLSKKSFQ